MLFTFERASRYRGGASDLYSGGSVLECRWNTDNSSF